jgi:hypothetical protein
MFEFPGPEYDPTFDVDYYDAVSNTPDPKEGVPGYEKDPNKKIVVSYSSINGNDFGGYGEVVMGTKGTLILEREQDVMLYKSSDTSTPSKRKSRSSILRPAATNRALASRRSGWPGQQGVHEEIEHWSVSATAAGALPPGNRHGRCIALTRMSRSKSMKGEPGFLQLKNVVRRPYDEIDGSSVERNATKARDDDAAWG